MYSKTDIVEATRLIEKHDVKVYRILINPADLETVSKWDEFEAGNHQFDQTVVGTMFDSCVSLLEEVPSGHFDLIPWPGSILNILRKSKKSTEGLGGKSFVKSGRPILCPDCGAKYRLVWTGTHHVCTQCRTVFK